MKLRTIHLWLGLIASAIILLEAVTGLLLVHTDWLHFDKRVQLYSPSPIQYQDDVDLVMALTRAEKSGKFAVSDIRLVMNHTLGDGHHGKAGNYKVRLGDENQTLYVIDTKGNVIQQEVNVSNNVVRDFHYGEWGEKDITWLIDFAAIVIILLTLTGVYLGIKDLMYQRKKRVANQ